MAKNTNLHAAKTAKNDEFYTRFDDINFEINLAEHGYRPFFKDKIVYCNCDDPEESNFWKFFKTRFNGLKLKKLISTHYDHEGKSSYKLEYDGERAVKSDGKHYGKVPAISVFTNLDIPKRHEPMLLGWKFEKGLEMGIYQKYDNYDAYNVDKVCQIPRDYDGVLGVPITFLDKYCPEQFEILNANDYRTSDNVPKKSHGLIKDKEGYIREREQLMLESASRELLAPGADGWHINGKRKYARIFVVLRHGFTPDNQGN